VVENVQNSPRRGQNGGRQRGTIVEVVMARGNSVGFLRFGAEIIKN